MYCLNCSVQLPDDANFCYKCSNPVAVEFESQTVFARRVEPLGEIKRREMLNEIDNFEHSRKTFTKEKPQKEKPQTIIVRQNSGFGAAFFTVFLLAALAVGGFFLYQEYLKEQQRRNGLNVHLGSDGFNASLNLATSQSNPTPVYRQSEPQQTQSKIDINVSPNNSLNNERRNVCTLSNNGNTVYLRQNCDTRDCTNDKSTIYSQAADNQEMFVANAPVIDSGIGFSWIPLEFDNSVVYAASSKLVCK